jgi:DNA gyrase/topoisomerase IV subunit A
MLNDELRNLRLRREFVSAYVVAVERRDELLRICANAPGGIDDVVRAVSRAFDVTEPAAQGILDLQIRRFTPQGAAMMQEELASIDLRIRSLSAAAEDEDDQ